MTTEMSGTVGRNRETLTEAVEDSADLGAAQRRSGGGQHDEGTAR